MSDVNVIDVGCAPYGGDYSIERLVDEFKPRYLVGLDPSPATQNDCYFLEQTFVMTFHAAAWIESADVHYCGQGLGGYVEPEAGADGIIVPAFDLARLVVAFAPVVLKIDAEGAEYLLLEHLMAKRIDDLVTLAWVEWHARAEDATAREKAIKKAWRGEMVDWRW